MDIGSIVLSIQGRDKGRYFVVLEALNANYVLIADGRYRRLEAPKKKKIKHIKYISVCEGIDFSSLTNNKLHDILKSFNCAV